MRGIFWVYFFLLVALKCKQLTLPSKLEHEAHKQRAIDSLASQTETSYLVWYRIIDRELIISRHSIGTQLPITPVAKIFDSNLRHMDC